MGDVKIQELPTVPIFCSLSQKGIANYQKEIIIVNHLDCHTLLIILIVCWYTLLLAVLIISSVN